MVLVTSKLHCFYAVYENQTLYLRDLSATLLTIHVHRADYLKHVVFFNISMPAHCGLEQTRIEMQVLGHSLAPLTCSLARSVRSLPHSWET